ncbi:unnamed protein product [Didymodactylos carnosus]|uniref:Uncharacterized protein n=1 Tax=Didymodactylos carnosus TaxID=1234261 RepID=A0A813SMV2_9BILA|nr:unnamed protein product [Didymodactylos carnosus]CAF0802078.1 unnamed protein product [Didymodactylos carnosus]CAF3495054.1 unnamed protein product [Didymodactylos carnosus]CAF3587165.1 unnamed protein product [Didymodactylos carnosus]
MNTIAASNGYHTSCSITNGLSDKSTSAKPKRKKLKSRTTQSLDRETNEQKKFQKTNYIPSLADKITDSIRNSDQNKGQSSATDSLPVLFIKTTPPLIMKKPQQTTGTSSKRDNKKTEINHSSSRPLSDTVSTGRAQSSSIIHTNHSIYQNHLHHKLSPSPPVRTPTQQQQIEQHIPSLKKPHINNEYCDSCGDCYGELISCDTCPATFHLLCANPPLSREDVPSGSYYCENCILNKRNNPSSSTVLINNNSNDTNHQQKTAFAFDPKKATAKLNGGYKLDLFDIKKPSSSNNNTSNVNHIKSSKSTANESPQSPKLKPSTLSNQRPHKQNSVSNHAISHTIQSFESHEFKKRSKKKSITNTSKRKRIDDDGVLIESTAPLSAATVSVSNSYSSPPISPSKLNSSVEVLKRLLLAAKPEEFKGPAIPYDVNITNNLHPSSYLSINSVLSTMTNQSSLTNCVNVNDANDTENTSTHIWQKYCFLCRHIKSPSNIHCPLVHCDYCPLTYHLDCLNPPLTSLPKQKWMCPNHIEPILDKKLLKHYGQLTCLSEKIKLYKKFSNVQPNLIIQEFSQLRKNKKYLTLLNKNKTHLDQIQISQIPKSIKNYYKKIFDEINKQQKKKFKMNDYDDDTDDDLDDNEQIDMIEYEQNNERCQNEHNKTSTTDPYDVEVWNTIQLIIDHVTELKLYRPLIVETNTNKMNDTEKQLQKQHESTNTLNIIDRYLDTLNEPNYFHYRPIPEPIHIENNGLAALVAAASSLYEEQQQLNQPPPPTATTTAKSLNSQPKTSTTSDKLLLSNTISKPQQSSSKTILQPQTKTFQLSQHAFYRQYSKSSNHLSATTAQSDTISSLLRIPPHQTTSSSSYQPVKSILNNDQQFDNSLKVSQSNTTLSSHTLLPSCITPAPFIHSDHVYNKRTIEPQTSSNTTEINQKHEEQSQQQSVIQRYESILDLEHFRLSCTALIHTRTQQVLYLNKRNIWFGLSVSNDICLTNFNGSLTCQYVSDKHACLYYDEKINVFELLNYSEYGTIVNGFRYGLGDLSSEDEDEDEIDRSNETDNSRTIDSLSIPLQRCYCSSLPKYHSAWDGAARIDAGTVIQIGCHEFLFYRYVVR